MKTRNCGDGLNDAVTWEHLKASSWWLMVMRLETEQPSRIGCPLVFTDGDDDDATPITAYLFQEVRSAPIEGQ